MSDISGVNAVWQHAIAKSSVQITTELYESLQTGPLREQSVFENARFAATMAAKKHVIYFAIQLSKRINLRPYYI